MENLVKQPGLELVFLFSGDKFACLLTHSSYGSFPMLQNAFPPVLRIFKINVFQCIGTSAALIRKLHSNFTAYKIKIKIKDRSQ